MAVAGRRLGAQTLASARGVNAWAPSVSDDHTSVYPRSGSAPISSRCAASPIPSNGIVIPSRATLSSSRRCTGPAPAAPRSVPPAGVPVQLLPRHRADVDLVRPVGDAQRTGLGVPLGQRHVVADPGAAVHLDGPVEHGARDPGGDD